MKKRKHIAIILLLCISLGCQTGTMIEKNSITVQAAESGTITASSLNVRTGAGTENKILQVSGKNVSLKKGTSVSVLSKKSDWYYISFSYTGKTTKGYVLSDYVKIKNTASIPKDNITVSGSAGTSAVAQIKKSSSSYVIPASVTADRLNVRTKANKTSEQVKSGDQYVALVKNTKVSVIKEQITGKEKWYQISFAYNKKTMKGYVLSDYIKLTLKTGVPAVINSASAITIRTGAGSTKSVLKVNNKAVTLKNATAVTISKEVTVKDIKWYQVSFTYSKAKKTGYLPASAVLFAKKTEPPKEEQPNENKPGGNDDTTDELPNAKKGLVIETNALRVRTSPGTSYEQLLDAKNNKVALTLGQEVTILSETSVDSTVWYEIQFLWNKAELKGYVSGDYIQVKKADSENQTPSPVIPEPEDPSGNEPGGNGTGTGDNPNENYNPGTALSDAEFEASMTQQGFPESYKSYLRSLHVQHPFWRFEALQTGLDWNAALQGESQVGKNLITNSKNIAWKSLEPGAYNWKTDKFVPFDGSTWVTASVDAIKYYMDPRNFLNENGIFQFESLSYKPEYQNESGVESILKNTAMSNTSFSYTDSTDITTTYGKTFIAAAEQSGVSPFHLASRVKQEVVTGTNSMSSSVSGKVSGYEGYYNYYNIGATHSTSSGGSVANGLKFAKNGTLSAITNAQCLIPWINPYKAIVGGAKYIGSSYIQRGQNTIYLQKFNMTSTSTYSHQYMANVEAGKAEAAKVLAAYKSMEELPVVFSIPVYSNMPETVCQAPADALNPNNWLSSLKVDGYELTPTFDINAPEGTIYSLIVPGNIEGVNISASAVSSKSSVTGIGYTPLAFGTNTAVISVTAENQQARQYFINIVRDSNIF